MRGTLKDNPSAAVLLGACDWSESLHMLKPHERREGGMLARLPKARILGTQGLGEFFPNALPRLWIKSVKPGMRNLRYPDDRSSRALEYHDISPLHSAIWGTATSREAGFHGLP